MSSRQAGGRRDGAPRRRRQLVIKERNISADEFMAASIGDVEWLDQSLRDGRNHSSFDKNGLAPIHLAALHGRLNCIQLLVEKYEVDVNLISSTGWTPLHLCINHETGSRALKCMNYLIENNADVNCQNDDCVTPSHQAASEGLVECMKLLIEREAELNVADVRGHLPLDLARLWSHKNCARIIRTEMWKREKQEKAEEMKQLNIVKTYYKELQKEAVLQLKNEQEFYGGVAFGNWLDDKGLPENLKNNSIFQRERYPDTPTEGLSKRLRTSGGLDDCAERMENSNIRKKEKKQVVQFAKSSQPSVEKTSKTTSKAPKVERVERKTTVKPGKTVQLPNKINQVKQVVRVEQVDTRERYPERKQQQHYPDRKQQYYQDSHQQQQENIWEGTKTFTPYSEITAVSERPGRGTPWNYSTNLESDPITNIKCKDTIALSIHPDEMEKLLPQHANLTVMLDIARKPKIKMTMPGGRIKSAEIRMPHLPSNVISDELSGIASDRIRIPQEFKAVHVYDLKKKRQPDKQLRPKNEIGMHLSVFGDPRILRKSMSSNVYDTRSPSSTISLRNDNLPTISMKNYNRTLDALHRMNPPHAFLA
ncbi:uncharacterized protein LOC120329036 [Styela clava]